MLKVVSVTTPLLSLLKIQKLSLLQDLYGQIVIPDSVLMEVEAGKDKVYYCDF